MGAAGAAATFPPAAPAAAAMDYGEGEGAPQLHGQGPSAAAAAAAGPGRDAKWQRPLCYAQDGAPLTHVLVLLPRRHCRAGGAAAAAGGGRAAREEGPPRGRCGRAGSAGGGGAPWAEAPWGAGRAGGRGRGGGWGARAEPGGARGELFEGVVSGAWRSDRRESRLLAWLPVSPLQLSLSTKSFSLTHPLQLKTEIGDSQIPPCIVV